MSQREGNFEHKTWLNYFGESSDNPEDICEDDKMDLDPVPSRSSPQTPQNCNDVICLDDEERDKIVRAYYEEADDVISLHGEICSQDKAKCTYRKMAQELYARLEEEALDIFYTV